MPLPLISKKTQEPTSFSLVKKIVGVAAGKGGVGKSTVAVQLAHALKRQGANVGILDADIYGPSLRKMLPEDRLPLQKGSFFTPALCQGVRVVSMAYFRQEKEAVVARAPIANELIRQFLFRVDWGALDYLIIDFPPGTGDIQLTLSQQVPFSGIVMVTTPQEVSALDVRKAIKMFEQVKVPLVGVVENMSYYLHPQSEEKIFLFGKGGGEKLARETGIPFLGQIPLDPELCALSDRGEAVFQEEKEIRLTAKAFLSLAEKVSECLIALKEQESGRLPGFELIWKEM